METTTHPLEAQIDATLYHAAVMALSAQQALRAGTMAHGHLADLRVVSRETRVALATHGLLHHEVGRGLAAAKADLVDAMMALPASKAHLMSEMATILVLINKAAGARVRAM